MGTDYLWRGGILNTRYRGRLFSCSITYFLSPVPSGSSANELWVDFELVNRATGKAVWTCSFRGSDCLNHWLYARIGKDVSIYPRLMKQAMNGALYDLS